MPKTERPMPSNEAECILARLVANFPGILPYSDGHERLDGDGSALEVNGGDLVEWISAELAGLDDPGELGKLLHDRAEEGTPVDDNGDYIMPAFRVRK